MSCSHSRCSITCRRSLSAFPEGLPTEHAVQSDAAWRAPTAWHRLGPSSDGGAVLLQGAPRVGQIVRLAKTVASILIKSLPDTTDMPGILRIFRAF
jgi:hypothetical protein